MSKDNKATMPSDAEIQEWMNRMKKSARFQFIAFAIFLAFGLSPIIWILATGNSLEEAPITLMAVVVLLIVAGCGMFILSVRTTEKIKAFASENITRDLLAEVFEVDEYDHAGCVNLDGVRASGLVEAWDRCGDASDLMRGKYKGRGISFSDIKLERRAQWKDSSTKEREEYWETVFEGVWIFLEQDKNVTLPLWLYEKPLRGGSNIETENVAFNNQFQIFTEDNLTAFLILTPQFMEDLVAADAKAYGLKNMCFYGNTTCIAIANNHNNFVVPERYKDIEKLKAAQRGEIRYLTNILDEFLKNDYLYGNDNPTGTVSERFSATKGASFPSLTPW